jgi:hypothetical protein
LNGYERHFINQLKADLSGLKQKGVTMNEDLLYDLQHCQNLLGQNDLEANNLDNQLSKVKKLTNAVYELSEYSRQVREISNELLLPDKHREHLFKILISLENLTSELIIQNECFTSTIPDASKKVLKILGNNHEAFMIISKLIQDDKDSTIHEHKKKQALENLNKK